MSEVILCASSCLSLWRRAKNALERRRDGARRGLAAAQQFIAKGKRVPLFKESELLHKERNIFLYQDYTPDEQQAIKVAAALRGFFQPHNFPQQPTP